MKLSNENIAKSINEIENFFESTKIPRKDKLRISLLLEEALLRYQEKFGENYEFKVVIRKWFGTPKVLIKIKGDAYNPIVDEGEDQLIPKSMMSHFLDYEEAGVVYKYENGLNRISAFASKERKKVKIPGGSNTIAIFLALIISFLIESFCSLPVQNIISEYILAPILKTLLNTVVAMNIPLIFISIVTSICGIENVSTLNILGIKIMKRFAMIFFLVTVMSLVVCSIFFPVLNFDLSGGTIADSGKEIQYIFSLILSIFPQNIIKPFIDEEILQIVLLALLTGICVTILGDRVNNFKTLLMNLRQVIFKIVDIVMNLIPIIIFLCIVQTVLKYSFAEILNVWKIIASQYVLFALIVLVMLLKIHIKHGVKILEFIKEIYPAFLISFTTGSGSASMPKNLEICKRNLKIQDELCDFYIPLSHTLCPTAKLIGIISCTFFAAEFSELTISMAQLLIIAFLSLQFAIAPISGNGGMIAIMSLLLTQLGFSLESVGIIAATDIFLVNLSGVITLIVRDCDLYDLSKEVKLAN